MTILPGNNSKRRTLHGIVRSQRGETITEVLVSMVIAGLALLMLATVIATSSNIVRGSRADMEKYYQTTNALASYEGGGGVTKTSNKSVKSEVPLRVDSSGNAVSSVKVDIYTAGSGEDTVVSYEVVAATTT